MVKNDDTLMGISVWFSWAHDPWLSVLDFSLQQCIWCFKTVRSMLYIEYIVAASIWWDTPRETDLITSKVAYHIFVFHLCLAQLTLWNNTMRTCCNKTVIMNDFKATLCIKFFEILYFIDTHRHQGSANVSQNWWQSTKRFTVHCMEGITIVQNSHHVLQYK